MAQYDPSQRIAYFNSLLTSPGEKRGEVTYMSSAPLGNEDSFTLRLFRHLIGMANRDGGVIVIGYTEDSKQGIIPDPRHTSDICSTYDTTDLTNRINSLVYLSDGNIKVDVSHISQSETGLNYPIIRVEPFENIPFFLRTDHQADDTGETILAQGALYMRNPCGEIERMNPFID